MTALDDGGRGAPEVLGYHHVSLSVTDLARSTAWYQAVLGLVVDAEAHRPGFRRIRLRAPGAGVKLSLTSHDDGSGDPFSERRTGMDHVAFKVGRTEDVEALKKRFEQLGIDHSEVKRADNGVVMITLRDPDGIQLEVFGGPGL